MHASGGRIIPDRLSAYHDLTPPTVDGREALARLADEASPGPIWHRCIRSIRPTRPCGGNWRASVRSDRDETPIADGPVLKPGESDARHPAIRARLTEARPSGAGRRLPTR
jgi:L,D-transpeptidase YcbB